MIREEIQIVRRRLDDYQSYIALAAEADRAALETQGQIDDLKTVRSPSLDKIAPAQNHLDIASLLNELISNRDEFEKEASRWRQKARAVEEYIDTYPLPARDIMRLHFVRGFTFEDLEEIVGLSASGLKNVIYRELARSSFERASVLL